MIQKRKPFIGVLLPGERVIASQGVARTREVRIGKRLCESTEEIRSADGFQHNYTQIFRTPIKL